MRSVASLVMIGVVVAAGARAIADSENDIINAFQRLDRLGRYSPDRKTVAMFLATRAEDQPLICIELARRLAKVPGDPAIRPILLDDLQYCGRTLDRTVDFLRGTDEVLWLYFFLSKDTLTRRGDLVEDVLLHAGESEAAQMAIIVRDKGLNQYTDVLARAVFERSWGVNELVAVSPGRSELWEAVFTDVLLRLDASGPTVDRALSFLDEQFEVLESHYPEWAESYDDLKGQLRSRVERSGSVIPAGESPAVASPED